MEVMHTGAREVLLGDARNRREGDGKTQGAEVVRRPN